MNIEGLTQTDQEFVVSLIRESSEYKHRAEAAEKALAEAQKTIADLTSEQERISAFQDEVRNLVIKLSGAPDDRIDGKGSDSGWEDFTLSEISQGFAFVNEKLAEAQEALRSTFRRPVTGPDDGTRFCPRCGSSQCRQDCQVGHALSADAGKDYVHKSQLEEAQKQSAAMREALQKCEEILDDLTGFAWDDTGDDPSCLIGNAQEAAIEALKSDAGRDFVPMRDSIPLVDALLLCRSICTPNTSIVENTIDSTLDAWFKKHPAKGQQ